MSQWSFVIAAYGLVALATVALVLWGFQTMRKAEADADALKRRP
jgi:uncharacterized membrane protein